jgi:hypothetical protein
MSSRSYSKHVVSNTQPVGLQPGDEWYNPVTNKLYKIVVGSGTTVRPIEIIASVTSTGTGANAQALITDGAGNLSFGSVASSAASGTSVTATSLTQSKASAISLIFGS